MNELAEWDIVTGVGITALGVAAGRAMETHRDGALVRDPYAEVFVEAAAPPVPFPTRLEAVADAPEIPWRSMADYMGVRSRFFDDWFASASCAGIGQSVLLAAGLDVRAYRLDWPVGSVVYELDAPKVLVFKDEVLTGQGARPRADRRPVAVDLREDWATALRDNGFDAGRPSAWLAEGLMPFLPNVAKQRMLGIVTDLSAPGSMIAIEHVDDVRAMLSEDHFRETNERFGIDMATLWPDEDDFAPAAWLAEHGWTVDTVRSAEVADRLGRVLDNPGHDPMRSSIFVTATRV